jgi:hypothetical protein
MKKNLSSAFLTTIIVCGLLSVITLQLGMAVKIDSVANSGNTIISSPKSTPLQTHLQLPSQTFLRIDHCLRMTYL